MPKHCVSDLITDQEMAFARLVLSGTKTDREAAQEVGLNPDTAAYTKAKPRVRAYMLEHRAAVQQQFIEQEAEAQRRLSLRREQVLEWLCDIAKTSAAMTRGSLTAQVKAISMIVAMEGLIPDRRAGSFNSPQPTPGLDKAQIYAAECLAKQQEKAIGPEPSPVIVQEEVEPGPAAPKPAPASAGDEPPFPDIPFDPYSARTTISAPYAPLLASAPNTKVTLLNKKETLAPLSF